MAAELYRKKLDELEKPQAYESQNGSVINGLLEKITNREPFSYDFNADPIYQQYKDSYTKAGKEASMNAVANASALTGGYGNSYAATAGAQANQQYLTELNNIIPELMNSAMNRYNMETEQLQNQYALMRDADDTAYQRYRDTVSDYYGDRDYLTGRYDTETGNDQWQAQFDYGKERDQKADEQWQAQFDYGKERDQVADKQWQQSFDYNAYRDKEADRKWAEEFNYSQQRDKEADKKWQTEFDYQKDRDTAADQKWQSEFDYRKERDQVSDDQWQQAFEQSYDQWLQEFNYRMERDGVSDEQWQKEFDREYEIWKAEFDESVREYDNNFALKNAAAVAAGGSGSGGSGSGSSESGGTGGSGGTAGTKWSKKEQDAIDKAKAIYANSGGQGNVQGTNNAVLQSLVNSGAFDTADDAAEALSQIVNSSTSRADSFGTDASVSGLKKIAGQQANYDDAEKQALAIFQNSHSTQAAVQYLENLVKDGTINASQREKIKKKLV